MENVKTPRQVQETSYKVLYPHPTLQKYVHYFWMGEIHLNQAEQPTYQHLAPASTTIDLLFFCDGHFKNNATDNILSHNGIIYGQKASFDNYSTTSAKASIFGIKLKPSVLYTAWNIPAYEITAQQIDLRTLFGNRGEKLTDLILSAHTWEEKITAFSKFLKEKQKDTCARFRTLEKFIDTINPAIDYSRINALIDYNFLSKRQFERDFKSLTGFSFRRFVKLKRFENFLQALQSNQLNSSLTQSAYQFGYYDQAHLNRDFREFTGVCPKQYIRNFCTE